MPTFTLDRTSFAFAETGSGRPCILQHGLSADSAQPLALAGPELGLRVLAVDCRGHGRTEPFGDPAALGIARFAADLHAFIDHLGLRRTIVGGISMGAAVALGLAAQAPELVTALVLIRPAWLTTAAPDNLRIFELLARHLREDGCAGLAAFMQEPAYLAIAAASPDNAASLRRQFEAPVPAQRATLLERVVVSNPGVTEDALRQVAVPALVIGNAEDPIHPLPLAQAIAGLLPQARLVQVVSKSADPDRHVEEVRRALRSFADGLAAA
jgi:pimeloyl-ACP methyl ester carboxylesterase